MPKPRKPENRGLPARWQFEHGAYYYAVPKGLEAAWDGKRRFRLGKTPAEAYQVWAERIVLRDAIRTIGDLLDRYSVDVVPTKEPPTQRLNQTAIINLKKTFEKLPITDLTPMMVYRYVDKRSEKTVNSNGKNVGGKVVAHREVDLLSHAFTKAVEWGYINRHPFKGEVRLTGETPRTRYVQDWEIDEVLALNSKRTSGSIKAIQAYIRIKIMTGMDRKTLLTLTVSDITEDGIRIARSKVAHSSGKETIYELTDDLADAIQQAKDARPAISPFLFCNRKGEGYYNLQTGRANGWDSMWQRFMDRVLSETKVTQRFTEHDLRAKAASDAPTEDQARALLSHSNIATTRRIYRRKAERVTPLKRAKNGAE